MSRSDPSLGVKGLGKATSRTRDECSQKMKLRNDPEGARKSFSSASTNRRTSPSPTRPFSASRLRKSVGSEVPVDNNDELYQKVDFLTKKTKTLEISLNKLKVANDSESENSHQWAIYLSELVKMDKHSIADIRDEVDGIKQRLHRLAHKETLERAREKSMGDTKIDIGSITEQVFNRVHGELTQIIDDLVRSCVLERTGGICNGTDRHTEETDLYRELHGQMSELKRRQQVVETSLIALGGEKLCEPLRSVCMHIYSDAMLVAQRPHSPRPNPRMLYRLHCAR